MHLSQKNSTKLHTKVGAPSTQSFGQTGKCEGLSDRYTGAQAHEPTKSLKKKDWKYQNMLVLTEPFQPKIYVSQDLSMGNESSTPKALYVNDISCDTVGMKKHRVFRTEFEFSHSTAAYIYFSLPLVLSIMHFTRGVPKRGRLHPQVETGRYEELPSGTKGCKTSICPTLLTT